MMRKGNMSGKRCAPKGKIEGGKRACAKCGVPKPVDQMSRVESPDDRVRYFCAGCLQ